MKIKDVFKIGGITQSISGLTLYLDRDNCVVSNKSKNENAVVLHLKRGSDGEEGNGHLRVRDEFNDIKDQLLNWAFNNGDMIGLTLNQLEHLETNLKIESSGGKLSLL
jgi:hypothetical protein